MLRHGQSVHYHYKELMWKLRQKDAEYAELHALYDKFGRDMPPPDFLESYHVYHDCGKHLTLTIGEDGKRRFPDHANVSADQYLTIFPDDHLTAHLIRHDMDFHTMRGEHLIELCKSVFAPILYFTAWAEINANAEMFGGKQSESYKIKRSRLIQAGKKLLNN